jgi:RimJ/RimL family protein N-acetyltransferase
MTTVSRSAAPGATVYELRVAGHLDDHWATLLGGLSLTHRPDGTTTLTGPLADQAQLHGVLTRVRDVGVPLLSLRNLDRAPSVDAHPALAHPLHTDRLTLRPATAADAGATWAYRRLPSVGEWLTEIPEDLAAYRATFTDPGRLAATVVVALTDHTVIGDLMLRVEDAWAQAEMADQARGTQAELGWVLDPAHTGHGYATEAVHALLDHCFDELGVRRVVATCFLANDASARLMERLGMRREALAVAEALHRSGRWLDTATYALLVDERAS